MFRKASGVPTKALSGSTPPPSVKPPSTPAGVQNRANALTKDPSSGVDVSTPEKRQELDDAASEAAGRTPAENQAALSGKETTPETIGEKPLGSNKGDEEGNARQQGAVEKFIKTPAGIASIAALGLTIALTLAFVIKAALAAKACTDCRDYKINITSIKPTPSSIPLIGGFFKPTTVDIAYTCPTDYEPLEGKETFTFKDTGFPEMDGMTLLIEKVLGKNKVQVKCGTDDCSEMKGTKGLINPNCGDFSDRFNREIEKAAEGAGNTAGSAFRGLFRNLGTALFVIAICFGIYFAVSAMSKS